MNHDKSTIFSICPFVILEFKPGLYPGSFPIPMCTDDTKPERLVLGRSVHSVHIADRKQPLLVETASYVVAESLVRDFLDGQLWTTPDAHPGICWVAGSVETSDFIKSHKDLYDRMREVQHRWYIQICRKTTDEYNKNQNTRVVSDQARFAARVLGLTPDWMSVERIGNTFTKCPACDEPNANTNAVCTNCRCILNEEKYKTLKFAS